MQNNVNKGKVLTTSENSLEGFQVKDYKGIAVGTSFKSINLLESIFMIFRNRYGGELKTYSNLVDSTYKSSLEKLFLNAKSMGANAILNLKFKHSSSFWRGICKVTATGNAVFVAPTGEADSKPVATIMREGNIEYAICPICNTKYKVRRNQTGKYEILGMEDIDLNENGIQIYCLSCGTKITIPEV